MAVLYKSHAEGWFWGSKSTRKQKLWKYFHNGFGWLVGWLVGWFALFFAVLGIELGTLNMLDKDFTISRNPERH